MIRKVRRKPVGAPLTTAYFEERSIPEPNTGCWLWLGSCRSNGYGTVKTGGRVTSAHRVAYEVANGVTLPAGIEGCHRCDNPACVNPAHIFPGSSSDNKIDCVRKGRSKARLTSEQVIAIREDGRRQVAIAEEYGIDQTTVSLIQLRKTWGHL